MTETIKKNGLVIRTLDYKDDSKIVFIITNEGLISLIARGANKLKSKNNAYTKELTLIEYNSKGKYLTTGKIINNYTNIKINIDVFKDILIILEMTYILSPHITEYKLFYEFLINILVLINDNDELDINDLYILIFRIKLLYLLGIAPSLNRCVSCDKKENLIGFSLEDGGMKCLNCVSDINKIYRNSFIKLFRTLYLSKIDKLSKEFLIELNNQYNTEEKEELSLFIDRYYDYYLGFKSKSNEIIKKIDD